jgi:hypothetical protein
MNAHVVASRTEMFPDPDIEALGLNFTARYKLGSFHVFVFEKSTNSNAAVNSGW